MREPKARRRVPQTAGRRAASRTGRERLRRAAPNAADPLQHYQTLLERHVLKPTNTRLRQLVRLIRELAAAGVSAEEIAAAHSQVMARLDRADSSSDARLGAAGQSVLLEVLRVYAPAGRDAECRDRQEAKRDGSSAGRARQRWAATAQGEQLRLLLSAVEQCSEGVAISDLAGNLVFVNEAFAQMHGYRPAELLGRHLSVFHMPEQMPAVDAANRQIQTEGRFYGEVWHARRDGSCFPGMMHNSLIRDARGRPIGMIATLRDVSEQRQAAEALRRAHQELEDRVRERTAELAAANARLRAEIAERTRAEQALRESEELFRTVVDASKDAMVAVDGAGLIRVFNPAAEAMFGRSCAEMVGQPLDLLMPPGQGEAHRRYVARYFRTGRPHGAVGRTLELLGQRSDGTVFPIELSLSAGRRADGPFVLGVIRDISERKRMEAALRRQALVFELMYDAVIVTDADDRVSEWNRGAERMLGYSRREALGREVGFWHGPQEAAKLRREVMPAVRRDGRWSGQMNFLRKDGSEGVGEVMIVAVRDESNNFLGTIGVGRDITDRLRTEEEVRRRQAELTQVTRAAAIGALTAGLAHELRQPLTAVLNYARGCARRLRRSSPATDEVLGVLHRVVVEAERASTILDTLRAFVGKRRPSLDPAELNTLVREAVELKIGRAHV